MAIKFNLIFKVFKMLRIVLLTLFVYLPAIWYWLEVIRLWNAS